MKIDHQTDSTINKSPRSASWKRWVAIGTLALVGVAGSHGLAAAQNYGFGGGWGGPCMMGNPGAMQGGPGMMRGRGMMQGRPGMMQGGGFPQARLGYMLNAINATPEQAQKITAIMTKMRADMLATRGSFGNGRDQFAQILGAMPVDKAAIEKMRADRVQAMDDASKKRIAAQLEVAELLTPEQRALFVQHLNQRRAFQRW